jgi:transposase InsO family protein
MSGEAARDCRWIHPECTPSTLRDDGARMTCCMAELLLQRGVPSTFGLIMGRSSRSRLCGHWLTRVGIQMVPVERWRQTYTRIRPHSPLGYRSPTPETIAPHCT